LYSIAQQLQRQPLFFVLTKLQLSVYSGKLGIQGVMKSNAKKLAEQDESVLNTSGIPYTIIRTGELQDTPGGQQGFTFDKVQITGKRCFKGSMPSMIKILLCVREIYMAQTC
jgi:hypothetical protein